MSDKYPMRTSTDLQKIVETGGASRREKFARNCGKADGCNLSEGRERKEFSTNAKSLYVADEIS